jgi:hypothetical protein
MVFCIIIGQVINQTAKLIQSRRFMPCIPAKQTPRPRKAFPMLA